MPARHRRSPRAPRAPQFVLPRLDLRPGRHTARRQADERAKADLRPVVVAAPPARSAPRTRTKAPGASPRAELARRGGTGRQPGVRVTPIASDRARGIPSMPIQRNYPERQAATRRTERTPGTSTRGQLGDRARHREDQGHAPTRPDKRSGEGARTQYRARGQAPRPASPLPGDPSHRQPARHRDRSAAPQTGRSFAEGFFGQPGRKIPKGVEGHAIGGKTRGRGFTPSDR